MSVEKRVIVAPHDRERTAGELEIDPTWRFVGWRDDVKLKVKREPNRTHIFEDDEP